MSPVVVNGVHINRCNRTFTVCCELSCIAVAILVYHTAICHLTHHRRQYIRWLTFLQIHPAWYMSEAWTEMYPVEDLPYHLHLNSFISWRSHQEMEGRMLELEVTRPLNRWLQLEYALQPLCVCYCWILFTSACLCRQNQMFLRDRRIFLAVFVLTKIREISQ